MRKFAVMAIAMIFSFVGYFFIDEKIAVEIWREVSLAYFVAFSSLLIGACFYIGLLITPQYTKKLAESDSTRTMRVIDEIFAKMIYFYIFALLFYFGWHIGMNAFIDGQYYWNAFLCFVLAFLFVNWFLFLIDMCRLALDIVKAISIYENKKGF